MRPRRKLRVGLYGERGISKHRDAWQVSRREGETAWVRSRKGDGCRCCIVIALRCERSARKDYAVVLTVKVRTNISVVTLRIPC